MSDAPSVDTTHDGAVALVTFARPPSNFVDLTLLQAIGAALAAADADPAVRAVVLASSGHELAEQAWLQRTADFAEGVRAVNERRPGRFVGA